MIYINAFIISGLICMIGQIILDNSKLTPGHITSMFACVGALLEFFNIYSVLIKKCGMGAVSLITNFGASLYRAGLEGFIQNGFLGIFTNLLSRSSLVLVSTIIFSFIITLIFKPKD